MGFKEPTRAEVAHHAFPVRLTIAVRGSRHDFHNMRINEFLRRARWPYFITPHTPMNGGRAARLYLPTIGAAMEVMLHCPELELLADPYRGATK